MHIPLRCTRAHPLAPSLREGDAVVLEIDGATARVSVRATPTILNTLMELERDGALVIAAGRPTLAEIAACLEDQVASLQVDRPPRPRPRLVG